MNCVQVRELLSAYLDAEISAYQAQKVVAHLQDCAACRDELATLRITARLVCSVPAAPLRVDLAPVVVARASASSWREKWAALREGVAAGHSFVVREFGRAAAIVALFAVAAVGYKYDLGRFVISWPLRVATAVENGSAYLATGITRAETLLDEAREAPLRSKPSVRPQQQERSDVEYAALPATVVVRQQEVSLDVLV